MVKWSVQITLKSRAQNRRGKIFLLEADDFLARAIQHEIDHLHGVLFTSKVKTVL